MADGIDPAAGGGDKGGQDGGLGGDKGGDKGGGDGSKWMYQFSPELRGALEPRGFKTPDDLGKAFLDIEKTVGAKGVIVPGDDAKPEELDKFYNALGRAETPDKVDLGDFKVPEALEPAWNADTQKRMVGHLHKAGLTNKQTQAVLKAYAEEIGADVAAESEKAAKTAETTKAKLKASWGAGHEAQLDLAERAVAHAFGKDLPAVKHIRLADGSYLLDNYELAMGFARIGALMQEEGKLPGGGGVGLNLTPAAAKAEIDKLKADEKFQKALLESAHPEHAAAMRRMQGLRAIVNAAEQG